MEDESGQVNDRRASRLAMIRSRRISPREGGAKPSIKILEAGVVGSLDYKIITAERADDLFQWLKDNKYSYAGDEASLNFYVQKKWLFTVMKIDTMQMKRNKDGSYAGEVTPTRFPVRQRQARLSAEDHADFGEGQDRSVVLHSSAAQGGPARRHELSADLGADAASGHGLHAGRACKGGGEASGSRRSSDQVPRHPQSQPATWASPGDQDSVPSPTS